MLAGLAAVEPVVAIVDGAGVEVATWPGTPVVGVPRDTALAAALAALAALGGELGVVVPDDAPDLPGLLVGKLFSALEDAAVSVLPAAGGGLVGLGARLPAPRWLGAALLDLDVVDAVEQLHAGAPVRSVVVGPGWHRLRLATDVARLDPGLEGWDATRALLSP